MKLRLSRALPLACLTMVAVSVGFSQETRSAIFGRVTDHPNLNGIVSDLSSASFGKPTSTLVPRYLQIGAKIHS